MYHDKKIVRCEAERDGKILSDHKQDGNDEVHRLYISEQKEGTSKQLRIKPKVQVGRSTTIGVQYYCSSAKYHDKHPGSSGNRWLHQHCTMCISLVA